MNKQTLIIIIISIAFILLNNAPFLLGYLNQNQGLVYLGRREINSQDLYTYVSFIEQSKQGRILFENLYTSEPQTPTLFRPSYIIIGKLAYAFNLPSTLAYHLARIVLTIIFIIILYQFLKIFFAKFWLRVLSLVITLTSSGLGYLFSAWLPDSSDLWIPESITFLSLQEAPHFILSLIYMVLGFWFFIKAINTPDGGPKGLLWGGSGISFLLLSFEHPFNLIVVAATSVLSLIWMIKLKLTSIKLAIKAVSIILPFLIAGLGYQVFETIRNPIIGSWASQNNLFSPEPINYLVGYGLILFLAVLGMEKFLKQLDLPKVLVLSWVISSFILLYAPLFFQRRLSEGLHLPLSILATVGLLSLAQLISRAIIVKAKKIVYLGVITILISFLSFSSLAMVIRDINVISADNLSFYLHHLQPEELAGLTWLKTHTQPADVILANHFYGNLLPGISGRKTYLGHKVQTQNFDQKIAEVNKFLLEKDSIKAAQFLKDRQINYIFLGKNDSILRYGFEPEKKTYLQKIYDQDDVLIFKAIR